MSDSSSLPEAHEPACSSQPQIECRAITGGDAAADLIAATRRAPAWPRRRRIALVGTRQVPHPSKHLCSAYRRLFRATLKALGPASECLPSMGNLSSHLVDPTVQQASGILSWGGVPLHVTVVDAAAAPRGSGFPIEPSHIVGTSGIVYCFSPFDRESFVAMQALQQGIITTLAPLPSVVVSLYEPPPESTLASSRAESSQSARVRVGAKGAAHDSCSAHGARPTERVVSVEEASKLAREWSCPLIEVGTVALQPDLLASIIDTVLRCRPPCYRAAELPLSDEPRHTPQLPNGSDVERGKRGASSGKFHSDCVVS